MPLTLKWRSATTLPVDAETLRPDILGRMEGADPGRLRLPVGNTTAELGELFQVEGQPDGEHLVLEGDLRHLRRLGEGLEGGHLEVRGDVGPYLGLGMTGGTIVVSGDVGAWAGAEMRGGLLQIRGGVGPCAAAALPGSRIGMRGGILLVEGPAGDDLGLALRRGLIAVAGGCGRGVGRSLIAGSIFVFGSVGGPPAAGMKRGTLALFPEPGCPPPDLLPSFPASGRHRPPVVTIYLRQLSALRFPVPEASFRGSFDRYNGDLVERGQGEILVWSPPDA